jgi:hypothetical protein
MSFRQIKLSDLQVNTCGQWTAPNGTRFLELPHTVTTFLTVAGNAELFEYEQGTEPDFRFLCKAVSFTGVTPGTLIQIQWPDGRYLQSVPMDFFSFVGTGKRARWLEAPKLMPPSSKIRLTIDNSQVDVSSDIELYFEGVLRIPMEAS